MVTCFLASRCPVAALGAVDTFSSPRLLHVPQSMLDKSIPFDLETVGSAIRVGSGRMQLNCTRQQLARRYYTGETQSHGPPGGLADGPHLDG